MAKVGSAFSQSSTPVAIIGSGPYSLSAAAHLRQAGVETRVFGPPMQFWREHMPAGMLLRSRMRSSHIANPERVLMLGDFSRATHRHLSTPLTLTEFVDYGHWFQSLVVPDLDSRWVQRVEMEGSCFRLTLQDGERIFARRVVVAGGIGPFAWRPGPFDMLPRKLVSHSSEHQSFAQFRGRRVLVVGAGQSALESAALLHESGADVEVIARRANIRWLVEKRERRSRSLPLLEGPPTDVGGRALGWLVAAPDLYRLLPARLRFVARRTLRPAGAPWLRPRLAGVPITAGRVATSAMIEGEQVRVRLDDGTERSASHVLLATGYRVDITRYDFIAPEMLRALDIIDGHPRLGPGLESSLPGLHFLGAPASASFGPIMRFVVGTWYAAPALTRRLTGEPQPFMHWSFPPQHSF